MVRFHRASGLFLHEPSEELINGRQVQIRPGVHWVTQREWETSPLRELDEFEDDDGRCLHEWDPLDDSA